MIHQVWENETACRATALMTTEPKQTCIVHAASFRNPHLGEQHTSARVHPHISCKISAQLSDQFLISHVYSTTDTIGTGNVAVHYQDMIQFPVNLDFFLLMKNSYFFQQMSVPGPVYRTARNVTQYNVVFRQNHLGICI